MTVEQELYDRAIKDFVEKHHVVKVATGVLENDEYTKSYIGEDGSEFFEKVSADYVKTVVKVKGVDVEVEVKLMKVEYWSTDDSKSRFYYEQY